MKLIVKLLKLSAFQFIEYFIVFVHYFFLSLFVIRQEKQICFNKQANIVIRYQKITLSVRMSINTRNKQYQMQHNPKFAIYYAHRRQENNHKVLQKKSMLSSPVFKHSSLNSSIYKLKAHNKGDSTIASRSLKKIQPRTINTTNKSQSRYVSTPTHQYPQQIMIDNLHKNRPLIFRKVAPVRRNQKLVIQKALANVDFTLNPELKSKQNDSDANSIISLLNQLNKDNNSFLCSPKNERNKLEESIASNLVVQKQLNIFLCKNCLEYFEMLEVKTHNKQCLFFSQKHEYIQKWRKLSVFIERLSNVKQSRSLKILHLYMKSINEQNLSKNQSLSIKHFQQLQQFVRSTEFQYLNGSQLMWFFIQLFKGMTRNRAAKKQFSIFNWFQQLTRK